MVWTKEQGRKNTGGFGEVRVQSKLEILILFSIKEVTIIRRRQWR